MYAIRAFRLAAGAKVDGQFYPHDGWTIVDDVTPALKAASDPTLDGKRPLIVIVEIDSIKDEALKPHPVLNAPKRAGRPPKTGENSPEVEADEQKSGETETEVSGDDQKTGETDDE